MSARPGAPERAHRQAVLVLTFLCYAGFHASRKPPSIVKSVLRGEVPFDGNWQSTRETGSAPVIELELPYSLLGGWAPFNGPKGQSMLGEVDLAFLGAYAIGMFYAGHLGDRLDLRLFLSAAVGDLSCKQPDTCEMTGLAIKHGMHDAWPISLPSQQPSPLQGAIQGHDHSDAMLILQCLNPH
ncbi:glycerol-3-phosphate permease-like protein [Haematococcus lacustris]|uniref:Glycerol-3-phosphate permease-like protein n=1 Tax=Haematococcus lacustris TaxID=44745 RepID=A0A699YHT7_HAELA|nr:glycerol-3-phosphate permease-like protein [Haematococcus lacustris]